MNDSPGNFSTHFLDACSDRKSPYAKQIDVLRLIDFPALDQIAKWVAFGQKFFLPHGSYVAQTSSDSELIHEADAEILKLPFPVTVLEYRMGMQSRSVSDIHNPLWGATGDKRITLLVDIPAKGEVDVANVRRSCFAEPIDPDLWAMLDAGGGVMAFALWFDEPEQAWSIGIGAFVVPRNQSLENVSAERTQELQREMNHSSLAHPTDVKIVHAFVPCLMGTYARLAHQHGHPRVQESMRNDVLSDACVATDFLRAFHCSNVQTDPVSMDGISKLNKRRQKAGKLPFFVYRVLVVGRFEDGAMDVRDWLRPGFVKRQDDSSRVFVQDQPGNPLAFKFIEAIAS